MMIHRHRSALLLATFVLAVSAGRCEASAQTPQADGVTVLLRRLEQIVQAGEPAGYLGLLSDSADRSRARDFAGSELLARAAHAVVQERDRAPLPGTLPGNGYRLIVDVFVDFGPRARIATWRLDVRRVGQPGSDAEWAVADQERISSVESVYRLTLNTTKQFTARALKIGAEDIDLTLDNGSVFVSHADAGVTGLVLLGHGRVSFHPAPETEKGQLKIFCGKESLEASFDAAYIRINPADFDGLVTASQLAEVAVNPRDLRRAQEVFREESAKSFLIDLGDLSRDAWSLLPGPSDFLAEIRTRKYDTLTYARSGSEAEDITFFDRKRKHNIALYTSRDKATRRGRFYNEDDLVDYDVLDYDIDVAASPDRQWIDGRTTLRLKVRAYGIATLTLRLADPLVVQSIVSTEYGRLFGIRVKNQNTLVINLPTMVPRDAMVTVTIAYAGRLEPQAPDRETIGAEPFGQQIAGEDTPLMTPEKSFLYSNRSYWYPQASVTDYATARMRIVVPATIECVASGELEPGFPVPVEGKDGALPQKLYVFTASQPLRYLAFILSRFARPETVTIAFPPAPDTASDGVALTGASYGSLNLSVEANPRQLGHTHDLADHAADIAIFYHLLLGDCPYSSFTVALVENDLPGGHSPAYFAALNQPLPTTRLVWRNDPAAFSGFPDFFIAHELAHQWWGQAVGWRNYHEQWLSEGFAQYFAALYARHQRGDETFASVMRQFRRWAMDESDQGPVYLGYRLGHIRNESRVFRALVYNKGAAVLHMLRRLVGDESFFRGLRRFYRASRFRKVGTEAFRAAMEAETGRTLERFFDRWIYGAALPKLKLSYRVDGPDVVLRVEQLGEVFDVPLALTLQYVDRKQVDVIVPVTDRIVEQRVPLAGTLRGIEFNKDDGTLADVVR
jgi:hypothetical protein